MKIKAISLWQPWATLKVENLKIYETRSWATTYRGPLAIHAAKKSIKSIIPLLPEEVRKAMGKALQGLNIVKLPFGAVIGQGELVACHLITPEFVATLSPQELMFGDFTIGRYAWEFKNMVKYEHPIPAKGAQGLWNWEKTA